MKHVLRKTAILFLTLVFVACGGGGAGGTAGGVEETSPDSSSGSSGENGSIEAVAVSLPVEGVTMLWVDGSTLAYIPAGQFNMGEDGGADNPTHAIQLSPYWMQINEVTNRQYDLCMKSGQCTAPLDEGRAIAVTEPTQADVPVAGVNWDQASAYCAWIQGALPTEAQWEMAARGPESRVNPWGDASPSCDLLNFENCIGYPTDVRQYADGQSYYGIFDMAGNVYEWNSDWYDSGYYLTSPALDPTGAATGTARVFRSSSYYSFTADVKAAKRLYMEPEKSREDVGFRCVVIDPVIQAPFCQASAVGIKPSGADGSASNSANCAPPEFEQGAAFCANGNSYANVFVTSGVLTSSDKSSLCNYGGIMDGTELFTCGPGEIDKSMKICGECTSAPSAGEMICPSGYTANPDGSCSWGVSGMESIGGCPPGWTPGDSNGGGGGGGGGGDKGGGTLCVYKGPKEGEHCPVGTYYDPLSAACVGGSPTTTPSCPAGFAYNAQAQCCQAQTGHYPGCGPNEFLNENGFCTPLLINQTSCVDITVSYINCEIPPTKVPNDDGGNDGGGTNNCSNITCNYPYVFDGVCSCVYNPKP